MIGKTKIAAGALAAVAVLAAGCGSSTTGQSTQHKPAPAQSTTQPDATQLSQGTHWFLAVLGGSEWAAFSGERRSLDDALKAADWPGAVRESRHVVRTADAFLAALRATDPEPRYQGLKEHLIGAVTEFRDGAKDGAAGIRDRDSAKIGEANRHMKAGEKEYQQVVDELGSLASG